MSLETILSQELVQRLGWTLLHFVWQAVAVMMLLAFLLAGLRKATANTRYIISCAALGLIVLMPIVTMQLVPVSTPQPTIRTVSPSPPVTVTMQPIIENTSIERVVEFEEPAKLERTDSSLPVPWKQRAIGKLEASLPYLVMGWLIGVFGLSLWHLGGWAQLQRLKKHMVKPAEASLQAKLNELAARLNVRRAVQLVESALVQVPTVVGWLRPVILLPASALTGLSTEQLEALLAHELAHIRRYDYLVNMLQTIVETLGFYHPAVWWVSNKIRTERENCCDDLAIAITGDRVRYARALTSMEEIRACRSKLAVAATGSNLFSRIRRLVGKDSADGSRVGWIPSVITILLIAIIAVPTGIALNTNAGLKDRKGSIDSDKVVLRLVDPNSQPVADAQVGTSMDWSDAAKNPATWFLRDGGIRRATRVKSDKYGKVTLEEGDIFWSVSPTEQMAPIAALDKGHSSAALQELSREDMGKEITLTLQPACRVHGRLTAAAARRRYLSANNLNVWVYWRVHTPYRYAFKQGRFDFVLPAGRYKLRFFSGNPNNSVSFTLPVLIKPGQRDLDLTEYLDGTSQLPEAEANRRGRVGGIEPKKIVLKLVDPNSQPVVGAWVGTFVDWSDIAESPPIWFLKDGRSYKASEIDSATKVISNKEGKITLTEEELFKPYWPIEKTVPLTAIDAGHYLAGLRELSQEDLGTEVTLKLQPGCRVRGRVTAATARKHKWSTKVLTVLVFWHVHWPCQYSSKEGRFEFVLPPGKYEVMVYAEHPDKAVTLPIQIKPGQRELDVTGYLDGTSKLPAVDTEPSAQFLLDKMLEHRSRVKNLQYVAESEIWQDPVAAKDLIEDQIKRMREKGTPEQLIQGLRNSLNKAPDSHVQILKCAVDDAGHSKIELTIEDKEKHVWAWNGVIETEYHGDNVTLRNNPNISITYGHPWRSFTGIFCKFLKETIEAGRPVSVEKLKDGTYRIAFDYKTSRYVAIVDSSKGYTCALRETYNKQGQLNSRSTATYGKVAEGIWFPIIGNTQRYNADGLVYRKSHSQSKQIKINDPAFNTSTFNVDIPKGARVRDFTRNAEEPETYRYGEPRQETDLPKEVEPMIDGEADAPSAEDKTIVKIGLSMVEVSCDSKVDRAATIEIKDLLGSKIAIPDSLAVADLLRKAAKATAALKDESVADKQVTQEQFDTLIDMLVSRGYLKILMNPTLQVVDGKTAKISSAQHIKIKGIQETLEDSIQITPSLLESGNILLIAKAIFHQLSFDQSNEQTPKVNTFEGAIHLHLRPGESGIMSMMIQITEKDLEEPDTEVLLILTPTILETAKQLDKKSEEKIRSNQVVLKLVDPNSQPVVGARVGTYVDWSDIAENPPVWFLRYGRNYTVTDVKSDQHGKVTLEAEELFGSGWTPEGKTPLTAIDKGHYLAGLREITREDLGKEVTLMLQPGCRVRGHVTAATARKHKWSEKTLTVYVDWREHRPCQYTSKQGRFEFILPPGTYKVMIYSDDPDKAVTLPIQIKPGQRELDLTKYIDGTNMPPVIRIDNPTQNEKGEQDKALIKVNCLVAEIWSTVEMDRETNIAIKNLLGFSRLTPGDALKQAVRATAKIEEANAVQKRVTQEQLDSLVEMLVDKGFVNILMSRTLNVPEFQTAQIESDQSSLEVTINGIKDDLIDLYVKADLSSQITPEGQGQKPMIARRSFTNTVSLSSGQSIVIGGMVPAPVRADAQASQPPATEIVCILTASIINPAADEIQSTNQTTINGRCRDSNGHLLANAQVLVYCEDFDKRTMKQIAEDRTDSEGRFSLGSVAPLNEEDHGRRRYLVFVPADGHGPAWKSIFSNTSSLELTTYDSAVVSGSVVTEDSKPVAGAQVWVRGIVPPEATEDPASRTNDFFTVAPLPGWSAITKRDGSFRIPGLPAGTRIQLFVSHRDFTGTLVHVKPGLDATIEVQPAAAITGRVLYGKTGQPAAGVMVHAQGVESVPIPGGMIEPWGEAVTDEQGRYTLESLYGTKYNIWAEAENLTVVALDSFQAKTGETIQAPDLYLIEGGFITGRVIDEATGKPVKPGKYSDVAIYGPSRPKSGAAVESSDIRDDGSFRIRVAPGRNYIYLRPMAEWARGKAIVSPPSHWINVAEDQTVEVEFKIRKFSKEELDAEAERMRRTKTRITIPKTLDEQKPSVDNRSEDANVRKVYDVSDLLVTTCLKPSDLVHHITEHVEPESWYALNKTAQGMITINPDARQANKIAIVQTPEIHSKIERLLEEVRRSPDELIKAKTQILIDVKILTASDEFMKYIGLYFYSVGGSDDWLDYLVHRSDDSVSFIIDQLHVDLLLKNATAHKGARMLAAPQIMALNGKKIEIQTPNSESGHYYMSNSPSEPNAPSGQAVSTSNPIELGTRILLTPHVTPDGKNIELDFECMRRRLLGFKQHTGPDKQTQKVPQIAFNSIRTSCPVPDGKTLLIAGKKITEQTEIRPKASFLKDLPIVGFLFSSPAKVKEAKNLLILVKPVINPPTTAATRYYPNQLPPFDPNDPLIKKLEARLRDRRMKNDY